MFQPKRSSDNYIQFKRKITNKEILNITLVLSKDRLVEPNDVLYQWIAEGAKREIDRRKNIKQVS